MKEAVVRRNLRRAPAPISLALGLCGLLVFTGSAPLAAQDPPSRADVIRFLEQATFGPTPELINHVQGIGFEAWLEEQFNLPIREYPDVYTLGCPGPAEPFCPQNPPAGCGGGTDCNRRNYTMWPLQRWFFQNALDQSLQSDQLRQRVAFTLNQIVVTSADDPNLRLPQRMLPYVQVLDRNAFGNYRDLLYEISLNPAMGRYLDNVGNTAARPNENYAREVLQLFSIGLDKLNDDGTLWPPGATERTPTYFQETVVNFTKGLTGWQFAPQPVGGITNYFDSMIPGPINNHDRTRTPLLNCKLDDDGEPVPVDSYYGCVVLPADTSRTAPADLQVVLDNIFNYPSLGVYIGKNLIQHLVTSNPSPAYVSRVTAAFNGGANGAGGPRGDMKAVIRAILLDPEARGETPAASFGHLKEPVLWVSNLLRAFNSDTDFVLGERFLGAGITPSIRMDEDLYYSPTVFNFFPPDYAIPGEDGVLGPEFAIQSTQTSLARTNFAERVIFRNIPANADRPTGTRLDLSPLEPLAAGDATQLVNYLNDLLLHGTMTPEMNSIVTAAVGSVPETDLAGRARLAVYLVATSSQYEVGR